MKITRLLLASLAALLAVAFSGCATSTKPKEAKADDAEYEWVTPVGSNIAVKVRKGQRATTGVSPTDTMTAEQFGSAVRTTGGAKPAGGN